MKAVDQPSSIWPDCSESSISPKILRCKNLETFIKAAIFNEGGGLCEIEKSSTG